jgi:hypothetical protein
MPASMMPIERLLELRRRIRALELKKIKISLGGVTVKAVYAVDVPSECYLSNGPVAIQLKFLFEIEQSEIVVPYASTNAP